MVKKIDSKRPVGVGSSQPVDAGKAVGAGKIGGVSQVDSVTRSSATDGTARVGRKLSRADRAQLMAVIEEESEKLFNEGQIPARKRKAIEGAVKMAIDASLPGEGEEE